MLAFVFGLLAIFIGLSWFLLAAERRKGAAAAFGVLLAVVGVGIIVMDSSTTVASRGVAVQTSFGKVRGGVLGPGFHWVAPWNTVDEFDASVQTLKFYKDERDDDGSCITVRLGNNTTACVDVTAQWNINHLGDVKNLYLQYKTFDNIHTNLVIRQLQSALNEIFGGYDPLSSVDANGQPSVSTVDLQSKVRAALQRDLGSAIFIDSVTIPIVHFDGPTEDRLRAFQQEKGNTRIAEQHELTAAAQARANKALADQVAIKDPGVQYQNCLNLIKQLADQNQLSNLPPTFNCNQAAAGPPVLLQAR